MKYFILILIFGCSSVLRKNSLKNSKNEFIQVESGEKFRLVRESGVIRKNQVITKTTLFSFDRPKTKPLEKGITVSTLGSLKLNKGKISVLRPKISQKTTWFSGKKYFSELALDVSKKSLRLKLVSPERKWNGTQFVKFPKGTGVYCFFSQIFECIKSTGFFDRAALVGAGEMNFHIVWDGYPYIQEQYPGIPNEVFTPAKLHYDGMNVGKNSKFTLSFAGQSLFLHLTKEKELKNIFWVGQGLSISRSML